MPFSSALRQLSEGSFIKFNCDRGPTQLLAYKCGAKSLPPRYDISLRRTSCDGHLESVSEANLCISGEKVEH